MLADNGVTLDGFGQYGAVGLLAGALYLLHRDALKTFREELSAERKANAANLRDEREAHKESFHKVYDRLDLIDLRLDGLKVPRRSPVAILQGGKDE